LKFIECPLVIADFLVIRVWGLAARPALVIGIELCGNSGEGPSDSMKETRPIYFRQLSPTPKTVLAMVDSYGKGKPPLPMDIPGSGGQWSTGHLLRRDLPAEAAGIQGEQSTPGRCCNAPGLRTAAIID